MGVIRREVCEFLSRISRARVTREKVEPRVILKILLRQLEDSCINCKGEQTEEKVEHTECNDMKVMSKGTKIQSWKGHSSLTNGCVISPQQTLSYGSTDLFSEEDCYNSMF